MKKVFYTLFLLALVFPQATFASWWNPFTWKKLQNVETYKKEEVSVATTTENVQNIQTFSQPSVEELLKRIAELEDKLEKALNKKETNIPEQVAVKKAEVTTSMSGLSDNQMIAKVKPAIVLVETATSSGSAVIVDSQGHVIVEAHTIWTKDENGDVVGVADVINVTLSNGSKKTAKVVGIDEALDVAVLQLNDKISSSYIKVNFDSQSKSGDKAYIFGVPSTKGNSSGGDTFVSGTVSQKTTSIFEMLSGKKPLDNGAMVNANGDFVGIPNKSACKVLEEMKTCIQYKTTATSPRAVLPKLLIGMKLYKDKKYSTEKEILIRGHFEGIYSVTREGVLINSAVENSSGKNSFDYFNDKLLSDEEGKIPKIYLSKLKVAADRIYKAMDFLKEQSYALNIILINENASINEMDSYQQKIIRKIEADNVLKLKEYKTKVDLWSKKKNEYDGLITRPTDATNDYLMEQGVFVESTLEYLKVEQKKIIDTFSGETIQLF
jgi:hypothetical protein